MPWVVQDSVPIKKHLTLRLLLHAFTLSHQDLANLTGYSRTTVTRVISGERKASERFRREVTLALNRTLKETDITFTESLIFGSLKWI